MLTIFLQLCVSGLCVGSVYALVALGYNLVFSTKKILNFAIGEFVMLGALVGYTSYVTFGWPLVIAALISGAVTSGVALLVERVTIRPFKDPRQVGWVMTTVGAGFILRNTGQQIWGPLNRAFPDFTGEHVFEILGVPLVSLELTNLVTVVTIVVIIEILYNKTVIGKAVRAVALDTEAASLVGIRHTKMVALAFGISGLVCGFAGILVSPIMGASPVIGITIGIKGFAAAALGGFGSLRGALIGGLLLGVFEVLASGLIWSAFQDIIALVVLISVLSFRPSGLFGKAIIVRA
jgi:branched-chain amino acid transport system permease protein